MFLVPRGCYDHAFHIRLGKGDVAVKALVFKESLKVAFDCPESGSHIEFHLKSFVRVLGGACGGVRGEFYLTHGKCVEHSLGMLPGFVSECQKRYRLKAYVAVIGNCESPCERIA